MYLMYLKHMVCILLPLLSLMHRMWLEEGWWGISYKETPWKDFCFHLIYVLYTSIIFSTRREVDRWVYFCNTLWAISTPLVRRSPGGIFP